jgi:hypothetical protein
MTTRLGETQKTRRNTAAKRETNYLQQAKERVEGRKQTPFEELLPANMYGEALEIHRVISYWAETILGPLRGLL